MATASSTARPHARKSAGAFCRRAAAALVTAALLTAGSARAQVISVVPSSATQDANGVIAFSVNVDSVPAPGLTSFAVTLSFSGTVTLVDGAATVAKDADAIVCSAGLVSGAASTTDLGADYQVSSGLGELFLASQGTGSILTVGNGILSPTSAGFVFGVGGATTPQTGGGALIQIRCFAGSNVPGGASVTVTPGPYGAETAALFLDGQGDGVGSTFVAGTIGTSVPGNINPIANSDSATTPEDMPVSIDVLANDTDADAGDVLTIANVGVPAHGTAQIVSGQVLYTPTANYFGPDSFTYTATDGQASSSALVTVSVTPVPDPPTIVADTATTAEDEAVSIDVLANDSDVDGDTLTIMSVTSPAHGTAQIVSGQVLYTPTENHFGPDSFSYTANDGTGNMASANVAVTVTPVPDPPTIVADTATTAEDDAVSIDVLANDSDVDGDTLTIMSVTSPAHGTAQIVSGQVLYTPTENYFGPDSFSYTANDGTGNMASANVAVTVTPVPDPPTIVADTATTGENVAVTIDVLANDSDVDGDTLTIMSVTSPAHGTAQIVSGQVLYTPAQDYSGPDSFSYTANDGTGNMASANVAVTVVGGAHAPMLAMIGDVTVDEGQSIVVNLSATDTDGDGLSFSTLNLPAFGALADNGNGSGTLTFTPGFNDSNNYMVTVIVTDNSAGALGAQRQFQVTVNNVNRAPQVAAIPPQQIDEASGPVTFDVSATDPDGDTLTLSATNLPSFVTFDDNGGGSGTFTFAPGFEDAGGYTITVHAADALVSDGADLVLTVNQVNRVPELAAIGPQQTQEGVLLTFDLSATDPDAEDTLSFQVSNLPTGATFTDDGDGTAHFSWEPMTGQGGNYNVIVTVFDDGVPVMFASQEVLVTVGTINRPPAFDALGPQQVNVGTPLQFQVHASDPDGDTLTLDHSPLPTGATFTDEGGGVGTFSWTPAAGQEGNYPITFTASDNGTPQLGDTLEVTVTVGTVNRPPVIGPLGAQMGVEGQNLSFQVSAPDPDGDAVTFYITGLPPGANFSHDGAGTAQFSWTPGYVESGVYPLIIEAQDDRNPPLSASVDVSVSIGNVNRPPILATIGPQQATVGTELQFSMHASDLDGDGLAFGAMSSSPDLSTATIDDNANGTATFRWTPSNNGTFEVTVQVADNGLPNMTDQEVVTIQVGPAGSPPSAPIGLSGRARGLGVSLRWSGSPTADSFTVYRKLNGEASFTSVGTTSAYGFNDTVPSSRGDGELLRAGKQRQRIRRLGSDHGLGPVAAAEARPIAGRRKVWAEHVGRYAKHGLEKQVGSRAIAPRIGTPSHRRCRPCRRDPLGRRRQRGHRHP